MPITSEPPPNPVPAGMARVRLLHTFGDTEGGCGFWLKLTGTPAGTDLASLAGGLYDAWSDTLLHPQSTGLHFAKAIVRYFTGTTELEAIHEGTNTGSDDSGAIAAQVAAVVHWGITESYRGGKARTYLPGVPSGAKSTVSTFTDAYVATLSTKANGWISEVNALAYGGITAVKLGTMHFFRAGAALSPPRFDPFSVGSGQKRLCTQRRRLGQEIT